MQHRACQIYKSVLFDSAVVHLPYPRPKTIKYEVNINPAPQIIYLSNWQEVTFDAIDQ